MNRINEKKLIQALNYFAFKEGGQTYFSVGMIGDNIKVLERPGTSVKAPEYSHTENRIYAIMQKGTERISPFI